MYECFTTCVLWRPEGTSDPLELEWQKVETTIWALRLESESSGRAAYALTDETSLLPDVPADCVRRGLTVQPWGASITQSSACLPTHVYLTFILTFKISIFEARCSDV